MKEYVGQRSELTGELLRGGAEVKMPPQQGTFREARRAKMPGAEQETLDL
jgi:hypothetical protein